MQVPQIAISSIFFNLTTNSLFPLITLNTSVENLLPFLSKYCDMYLNVIWNYTVIFAVLIINDTLIWKLKLVCLEYLILILI